MESELIKQKWGWEYVSKNGNSYSVGPVTAEFNVIVDDFEDINKLFDYEAIVHSHLVDYVYGDIADEQDDIKNFIDSRIDRYEKYERTVKFYTNLNVRSDAGVLYECYVGLEKKRRSDTRKIEINRMHKIAKEVKGGR